ncbi:MAG: Gfo/Idh/MocA family oxidoreductase [Planctomyces sp.]
MNNRLRLAVAGVGALGRHHARILSGFDDVQLVGVVEPRREQGERVASDFGTRWFPDVNSVIGQIDGIVVAVPTVFHAEVALPILKARIPVLMEKPLASSLQEALQLHRMAAESGTFIQVGHVERFNPAFDLLRKQIGRPLHIRCQRVSPYTFRSTDIGVVHDLMIHDIDLILALTGSDVCGVESFGSVTFGPHEDMAVARIRTQSGVIVDLTASRMCPTAERSIQVWSDEGFASADLSTRQVTVWRPEPMFRENPALVHTIVANTPDPLKLKDEVFTKWIRPEILQASSEDALTAELRDFVHCIRTGSRPRVNSFDAVRAMEVAGMVLSRMEKWSWQNPAAKMPQSAFERRAA